MNLLVVSDIFGLTKALTALVEELSPNFETVEIVTPYGNNYQAFENEAAAYAGFQRLAGLTSYVDMLHQHLKGRESDEQLLLGFSVGASAIWSVSERLTGFTKTRAIGFYSSQIRKFLQLQPEIPVHYYFAKSEPEYDVDSVSSKLAARPRVTCTKTNYPHGFMSRDSLNFSEDGFREYLLVLKKHCLEQL